MAPKKSEIKYEIKQQLGELGSSRAGWTRELNLVSWNDGQPKLDIRDWNEDHSRMSKGITLDYEQTAILRELLNDAELDSIFAE